MLENEWTKKIEELTKERDELDIKADKWETTAGEQMEVISGMTDEIHELRISLEGLEQAYELALAVIARHGVPRGGR